MSDTNQEYPYGYYPGYPVNTIQATNGIPPYSSNEGWTNQNQIPPTHSSYGYYYRQQVSSARPRHTPAPFYKHGNDSGFYGSSGDYSMDNLSGSGRSNIMSPTYTSLTEVLASYIPGDSTFVFMEPRTKRKWGVRNLTKKFMAFFFIFTILVSGFFLLKNEKFGSMSNVLTRQDDIEQDQVSEIENNNKNQPKIQLNIQGDVQVDDKNEFIIPLNNIPVDDNKQSEIPLNIPNHIGIQEEPYFKRPIKITYSFDEDDGEVYIENE